MRITVPEDIIRLTVPTWTPSRDKPLVIVSPLELGGDGLHILVWVVQLVGCLVNLLWEHRRLRLSVPALAALCSINQSIYFEVALYNHGFFFGSFLRS